MTHTFFIKFFGAFTITILVTLVFGYATSVFAAPTPTVWWPTDGARMQGVQPLKAAVDGTDISSYAMYWQVDGGTLNLMQDSYTDAPHKEANVDVSGWNWHGAGPYAITFVAQQNGTTISQKTISVYNGAASATTPVVTITPAPSAPTAPAPTVSSSAGTVNVWWPTKNASLNGTQPFKAVVPNSDINSYSMYWQVDGGAQSLMQNNSTDGAHKEANVDMSSWHWQNSGIYTLTFTAKDASGAIIATYSEPVVVNQSSGITQTITQTTVTTPVKQQATNAGTLYVDPNSGAAAQAAAWMNSRPTDAAKMKTLANEPTAKWFGEWSGDIASAVSSYMKAAGSKTGVLVAYNIPQRDCGGYSAGGSNDYITWISSFAKGIGSSKAIVILEPDSLAQVSCLSSADQANRYALLSKAVTILTANPNTTVYLDAGHSGWVDAATMASRLTQSNIKAADGFSLNVSNYNATSAETAYGTALSKALGGTHFVIDTSRNGNGSNGEWCNANGSAIGTAPTTQTGNPLIDAFLWIKTPGESDGTCNGGPSAGTWWGDYALNLVKNIR
ncbi:MAG: hypothetical protein JWL88_526 [Parcubacteria group bacterium]|nr:hypothetical protein [Parcubacteria group bacterium]